jgi:putative DNA primase/helicase
LKARSALSDLIDLRQLAWYCATIHRHSQGLEGLIIPMAICPCQDWEGTLWTDYKPYWVGDCEPMQRQIEQWVLKGANVYVPWCVFGPDTPPSSRGSQKHVLRVLALAADRDADTGKFGTSVIKPTYQIVSSRIPFLNFNELYVFDRPLEPGPAIELGRDLRKAMGADSGTGDIVRLVRVAGTANYPNFKKIAERNRPREPQPLRLGDGGSNVPIDNATLAKAISVSLASTSGAGCAGAVGSEPSHRTIHGASADFFTLPQDLRDDIARNDTADRSAHSFHVVTRLFDQGLSNDEVFSVLSQHPEGAAEKFISRGDLAAEIERCRHRCEERKASPNRSEPQPSAPPSEFARAVERLAALDPPDYDPVRKSEAATLGVRVSALDDAVKRARPRADEPVVAAGGGRALSLPDTEPWPNPVDGAEVLNGVSTIFSRHLALPEGAADTLALWSAFTYAFDAFFIAPRLAITSPEMRCGKTTLLRLLAMLCERVLLAANITPAAVFRTIELVRPALLIDEADTFLEKHEELRGVLNSGHTRDGCVIRTVGDDHEPREFSTWAPCAVAMIGRLPDTLADRSIRISMRRRMPGEKIDRLRTERQNPFNELRRKLARFALDARAIFENADPLMAPSLDDRAADNWRVLLAIAEAAGGDWPGRAIAACAALNAGLEADDTDSIGTALLRDIRAVFKQKGEPEKLSSTELCQALSDDEASPWAAFGRSGKPITPPGMARLLKRFKIAPKVLRNGAQVWCGYLRDAFADAWARYLPPDGPPQGVTALQTLQNKDLGEECTRNTPGGVTPGDDPQVIEKQGLLRCNGSTCRSLDGNDESARETIADGADTKSPTPSAPEKTSPPPWRARL